ncbi:uncharacterized protein FIBRA_09052 [Fibroporia radiculosa]|uniref:G-protein coupled receptors family 1 profile domain-containing protein n=1 Tax=Fibroporia radiculosa TaxID=599839 RepID=J4GXU9_9APHY|nr:uncharacterized protein FIBRA_09052 [Fibroporia radiculosa]CCM06755.1 predicted protein [Fibroporia radiculosa]
MGQISSLPLEEVLAIEALVEATLFGIFFVLSTASLYLLIRRSRMLIRSRPWPPLTAFIVATVLIFVSNTMVNGLVLTAREITYPEHSTGSSLYFSLAVAETGALLVTVIVNDVVMIYRLWIVWSYSKRAIVLPLCTLIGLTFCGVTVVYQESRYEYSLESGTTMSRLFVTNLIFVMWSVFTLCTNVYCTVMIAWRIWYIHSAIGGRRGSLMSVLAILVESAAIYTIWTIFFLIACKLYPDLQPLAYLLLSVVTGISFMLINVRVGMGWEEQAPPTFSTFVPAPAAVETHSELCVTRPMVAHAVGSNDSLGKPVPFMSSSVTVVHM